MEKVKRVTDWKCGKLLIHPVRKKIVDLCRPQALSISDLAHALELNPGSVHNHVHKLANAGFLEIEATREINGIVEKKYRRTAQFFRAYDVSEEDIPVRNRDISNAAARSMVRVMEGDVRALFIVSAQVSAKTEKQVQSLCEEIRRLLVEADGEGSVEVQSVVCFGRPGKK